MLLLSPLRRWLSLTWLLSHPVLETCLSVLKWQTQSAHRINGFLGCFLRFSTIPWFQLQHMTKETLQLWLIRQNIIGTSSLDSSSCNSWRAQCLSGCGGRPCRRDSGRKAIFRSVTRRSLTEFKQRSRGWRVWAVWGAPTGSCPGSDTQVNTCKPCIYDSPKSNECGDGIYTWLNVTLVRITYWFAANINMDQKSGVSWASWVSYIAHKIGW